MSTEFLLRAGQWQEVRPEEAGWRYLSFRVETLPAGAGREFETGEEEVALVPLAGRAHVATEGATWELGDRPNVFDGPPWTLYLPRGTPYLLTAVTDLELAVCGARCNDRREPILVTPDQVEIEVRGASNATRQINHLLKPEFPAERLLVVEVLTPAGNWSSYPPHKHDEDRFPDEVALEETYYFRTASPQAFAVQRLYSPPHDLDLTATVRDGDLLLVPFGYHATCAAHCYDLYYLNALAGNRRSMAASDDPDHAWIRQAWSDMPHDPRVPVGTPRESR
jgi:5-deoxy-glucuronate isomerase